MFRFNLSLKTTPGYSPEKPFCNHCLILENLLRHTGGVDFADRVFEGVAERVLVEPNLITNHRIFYPPSVEKECTVFLVFCGGQYVSRDS